MKYILLLLTLFSVKAKAQWNDNFSDGNLNSNPKWNGDTVKFTVNTAAQLQLNAVATTSSAYLSTPSSIGYNASWTFLVKMDFNPSSSNYAKVFLMADQSDLTASLNGYFLKIGCTDDKLSLFRKEGNTETLIADGNENLFNTAMVNVRIKVTRDELGNWNIYCDSTGNENYRLTAHGQDNVILKSIYFGLQCIYTSTRSTKFYFDGFVITGEEYKEPLPVPDSTQLFDIVFNEIMADPTPVAELPEVEYIELYNRSPRQINLKGWKLMVGSYRYSLPDVQLPAGNYLIITSKGDETRFESFGKVIGLFSSLNNTGQYLKLENKNGRLISWVEYDDSWYGDDFKAQGGWSLEQIDPLNPCGDKTNWKASASGQGGTPGSINSVFKENPDITLPDLLRLNVPEDSLIELYFTEALDSTFTTHINTYDISDIGEPKQVIMLGRNFSVVQLILSSPLVKGKAYSLSIKKDITDCTGHSIAHGITLPVGLPLYPDSADVIINEVLFNAKPGGVDYVELYNRSNKILNARNLLIGISVNGKSENLCRLSETGFLINPGAYLVVASNCEKISAFYHVNDPKCLIDLSCMPSLDDKSATIILQSDTLVNIDEFSYSESMHLPILKNLDGISLERVNFNKPSYFPGNWHSAAEIAGYGTPGYKNSQYLSDSIRSGSITLSDDLFSPDNDGYKDMLQITYGFDKVGCRAQVCIFDAQGRLVRQLLNNELLSISGSFTWDGTSDAGKLCNVGIYVIFIRIIFDDGTVKEYKKSCLLALRR